MDGAAVAACGVCGVGGQTVVGEVHTVLEGVGAGGGGWRLCTGPQQRPQAHRGQGHSATFTAEGVTLCTVVDAVLRQTQHHTAGLQKGRASDGLHTKHIALRQ